MSKRQAVVGRKSKNLVKTVPIDNLMSVPGISERIEKRMCKGIFCIFY